MDHFSTFIQSLRQKINKGELERKKIADIVSIHIGVDIKTKDLHIKNNTVRVYKVSDIEKLLMEIETSRGAKPTKNQVRKLLVQHLSD
jgi:hypothetical protein